MHRIIMTLSRQSKRQILLVIDIALVPIALFFAVALQNEGFPESGSLARNWLALPLLMSICGLLSSVMGVHKVQLKAYENHAIGLTAIHAILLGLATAVLDDMAGYGTSLPTFINFALIYFLLSVATRMSMLQVLLAIYRSGQLQTRVLIYGAGPTGRQLAAALRTDEAILPVAFVDDALSTQSTIVQGLTVYSPLTIEMLVREKAIDRVLIAMPDMPRAKLAQLSRRLEDMGLSVQALPSFAQLTGQSALIDQLQPVIPSRFLGRAALDGELPGGADVYRDKVVLISGAGGSIGSELCRQILSCGPAKLVLLDISELALYTIDMELSALIAPTDVEIVPTLGSITDPNLVQRIMCDHGIEIVLHAAAYKHVPLVESNPVVGLANNVLGTHVLASAAVKYGVGRFILISSDKAVRPKNMMGASKRLAEIIVQDLANRTRGKTVFSMVRFGNVMGSSGSVIPLFQDQIKKGGPITLTHPDVTRYFMTIPEAARLVLVAGSFASSGEVYVLDMGDPIPIRDLARQMIAACGYTVRDATNTDGDIEIQITGLRPGEKIHEELLIGEGQITTQHPKILQAREKHLSEIEVASVLKSLRAAVDDFDEVALRAVVARWVEGGDAFLSRTKITK